MTDSPRPRVDTPPIVAAASQATWVAGLTLALSSFMGWYSSGEESVGPTISVLGWNTGTLGKFVFVLGLAIVLLAVRRGAGIELPRSLPESLIVVVLATAAAILLLIRIVSIPDEFAGTADRAIGLWVGLASAAIAIVAGLVRAGEEL